jgi:CheY-like chemotaxis protein
MTKNPGRKTCLLIIEDNPGDVTLLGLALQQAEVRCDVSVIEDGGAALEFLKQEKPRIPDLVVLDLNLPKADGREVLYAMRSTEAFANVPVVIWTSSNAPHERAQLNALGVTRYLVKPPDLNEFLKLGGVIKDVLEECERGSAALDR